MATKIATRKKRTASNGRAGNGKPTGSKDYQKQRAALLTAELELLDQSERVAQMRRKLPLVRKVKDYTFREGPPDLSLNSPTSFFSTKLSDLFAPGKDSLIIDHLMFGENEEKACPMCSMWADGYNAIARHVSDKTNFVLVAKADIGKLRDWARARGWHNIRLLSSHDSTFNRDFGFEHNGQQQPGVSVFRRKGEDIYHFYSQTAELVPDHFRGIDLMTPVWNLFDVLPEGREDWHPEHFYY
ncbi:MAG TPA: DUF899 family protein [Candidatus Eremiobacteraceae bacterium]|nr:DUF899 family protein [Candidatus Eremiobacteraceae bacterium]